MNDLERCISFLKEIDRRAAGRQVPFRFGTAYLRDELGRRKPRLENQRTGARGLLGHRTVNALFRDRLAEIDAVDRAHDTDDPDRVRPTPANLLTDGTPSLEVPLYEVLVDHGDRSARRRVGRIERTPLLDRNVHRLEVISANDFLARVRLRLARPGRVADDRVGP